MAQALESGIVLWTEMCPPQNSQVIFGERGFQEVIKGGVVIPQDSGLIKGGNDSRALSLHMCTHKRLSEDTEP